MGRTEQQFYQQGQRLVLGTPKETVLTLPLTNMDNGHWEDHFPLQTGGFPLPC